MHGRDTTKDRKRSLIGSIIGSVIDMEEEDMDESMGAVETAINLVKCAAGCGMFSLPYAYKQGGLYLSIAGTLFFGLVSAYTVQILAAAEASPPPPNLSEKSTTCHVNPVTPILFLFRFSIVSYKIHSLTPLPHCPQR